MNPLRKPSKKPSSHGIHFEEELFFVVKKIMLFDERIRSPAEPARCLGREETLPCLLESKCQTLGRVLDVCDLAGIL